MNNVTQAAYEYGEAVRLMNDADVCGAPLPVMAQMRRNVEASKKYLLQCALEHYDSVYDGATE